MCRSKAEGGRRCSGHMKVRVKELDKEEERLNQRLSLLRHFKVYAEEKMEAGDSYASARKRYADKESMSMTALPASYSKLKRDLENAKNALVNTKVQRELLKSELTKIEERKAATRVGDDEVEHEPQPVVEAPVAPAVRSAADVANAVGGNLWEHPGTGQKRWYLNADTIADLSGLDVEYYKSGNVSKATLDGERISNSEARGMLAHFSFGKFYLAADDSERGWSVLGRDEDTAAEVQAHIEERLSETA